MIRFMCLSVCIFFTLFLSSGCATVTRSIKDPDIPPSEIRMKYPYKFYISSIHFFNENREIKYKSEIKYSDEQAFITDIRKKLAVLYPQIFVAEPNDSTIPINYEIAYFPNESNNKFYKFLKTIIEIPIGVCEMCSFGLFPVYYLGYHDMQVHAQIALKINASCQREVVYHSRSNGGLLGFFNTRKLLPDFSNKDVPMEDGVVEAREITSSECSEKFLKLFVYALQELDHTQIQLLYNEKYHPKVDFILP